MNNTTLTQEQGQSLECLRITLAAFIKEYELDFNDQFFTSEFVHHIQWSDDIIDNFNLSLEADADGVYYIYYNSDKLGLSFTRYTEINPNAFIETFVAELKHFYLADNRIK